MQVKPVFGDYGRIGIDILNLDQCFLSCKGGRGQIKKEIGEGNIITVSASIDTKCTFNLLQGFLEEQKSWEFRNFLRKTWEEE